VADYLRSLTGAPPNKKGSGPDLSMADFFWCMLAVQRDWSTNEVANELLESVPEQRNERACTMRAMRSSPLRT
jgi:hypothetical protein